MPNQTCVLIKPDAVHRGVHWDILDRIQRDPVLLSNVTRVESYFLKDPQRVEAEAHYAEHKGKPFFDRLCDFLCSGPIIVVRIATMDWDEAQWYRLTEEQQELCKNPENIVKFMRKRLGAVKSSPDDTTQNGTLRGDFGTSTMENAVHASDSAEAAERELRIWPLDASAKRLCLNSSPANL